MTESRVEGKSELSGASELGALRKRRFHRGKAASFKVYLRWARVLSKGRTASNVSSSDVTSTEHSPLPTFMDAS